MLKYFILLALFVVGCENLKLKGSYATDNTRGFEGGTHQMEVQYKAAKDPFDIIISSRVIHDIKQFNKPKTVATSIELWFW